ncbi:MAG: 50S ribosomal protein L11 [Patescibacteria group bacterium]
MAKKVKALVKITLKGGQATAAPPVGTALSPQGVPIMDFVKAFNERTKEQQGTPLPVVITIFEDRTFAFIVKKPPVAILIKKALNLEKGAQTTGKQTVGKLTLDQAKKIAEEKMPDLNTTNLDAAVKIVQGTARSMGVELA